ncbi:MAG: hypothetical protein K2K32_04295 [Muribaculaceae bacterium]|nr:hypothetical protein [Muribaculaceae bacterium]
MMKHPLTSKERRGLVAVAAAALLCICSGFIFRNCNQRKLPHSSDKGTQMSDILPDTIFNDSIAINDYSSLNKSSSDKKDIKAVKNHKTSKSSKDSSITKSSKKRNKRNKVLKSYPTRDPLSEPCD